MDKIAIGPGYPAGLVDLDASPRENINALAKAKGVKPGEITVLILDRLRHADLIVSCREAGAAIRLITDGDVAGVIHTTQPEHTGIDLYLGTGGAPEGVLAAGALRCVGGQMQTRLILDTEAKVERARKMGVSDPKKKYDMHELASGDVIVCATGVTDGAMLKGVKFGKEMIETETVIYRSVTGTVRRIHAEHREMAKFRLD
jgi:fructose-1,6-bisphosphatase II / sedoheptulose-1,7-bisphosphatase